MGAQAALAQAVTMLGVMLLLAMQAEAAPPPPPTEPPKAPTSVDEVDDESCEKAEKMSADTRTIVVCAQRPQGYRLNPDVMAAKRIKRSGRGAAPRPAENFKQDSCSTVGPMGCRGQPAIDFVAVGVAAAQMAAKAAKGENVGEMFQTDKQLSEYELYLLAKRQREAREEDEAAAKAQSAAKAKKATEAEAAAAAPAAPAAPKP